MPSVKDVHDLDPETYEYIILHYVMFCYVMLCYMEKGTFQMYLDYRSKIRENILDYIGGLNRIT